MLMWWVCVADEQNEHRKTGNGKIRDWERREPQNSLKGKKKRQITTPGAKESKEKNQIKNSCKGEQQRNLLTQHSKKKKGQ
jgi:hypothetical protein